MVASTEEHIVIRRVSVVSAVLITLGLATEEAQARDEWQFEIIPHLWAAGTDADVTMGSQTASVKREFADVDLAGSVLGVAQRDGLIVWTQLDYLRLNTDELKYVRTDGELESDAFLATMAVGHQFGDADGRTFDVLLGVRHFALESKLTLQDVGQFEREADLNDLLIIVRPSWPFADGWRFDTTMSIGAGDSELTWELQPQFEYLLADGVTFRVGYRHVFYEIKSNAYKWEGAFRGLIVGFGAMFGG
jgi:hypothetical protein